MCRQVYRRADQKDANEDLSDLSQVSKFAF